MVNMLEFIKLEDRENPSLYSHDGYVILPTTAEFRPFGDFNAANYTAGKDNIYVVGAAEGGGPRVQVLQSDSKDSVKVLADFFAYETTFTGGVRVSTDSHYIVTSPAKNGGSVIAVYDTTGQQISRFFAFDPSFNGGADVQIKDGIIYVTAGQGGGPIVQMFDIYGNSLGAFFGANSNLRTGFNIIVSPDAIGNPTINLIDLNGHVYVNKIQNNKIDGYYETNLPKGFKSAGYSGLALSFGMNGYRNGDGIDLGFNEITPLFYIDDHAAGNPNPPPTTGFRPGVYFTKDYDNIFKSVLPQTSNTTITDLSGESVGANETGTGTLFLPMIDDKGNTYAVTASHVTDMTNYQLISPGPLDGPTTINYGYPTIATNYRTGTYSVDASATPTTKLLKSEVLFNGTYYAIDGIATPKIGDMIVAVGRGIQTGVGIYQNLQDGFVNVQNGYAGGAQLTDQYVIGTSIYGPLAIPGFSGGPAFSITVDSTGIHRWLIGMVVAGDGQTTYVTPVKNIEQALNLKVKI